MTDSVQTRARRSLRLLLESDREFGLEEVAWRVPAAAIDNAPAIEPEREAVAPTGEPVAPSSPPKRDIRTAPPDQLAHVTSDAAAWTAEDPPATRSSSSGVYATPPRDRLPNAQVAVPPLAEHLGDAHKRARLDHLEQEVTECGACVLSRERQFAVPGEGSVDADLMFVGEGPGRDEDRSGRPFVGAAGALLTKIIHAIGFTRETVFIANAVKCRPPGNRTPEDGEILACLPFLSRQIEIVRPKVICALGRPAVQALLRTSRGINALRGTVQSFDGIPVVPTFHPAYLLRRPEDKVKTWADVQLAVRLMIENGGAVPHPEVLARNTGGARETERDSC